MNRLQRIQNLISLYEKSVGTCQYGTAFLEYLLFLCKANLDTQVGIPEIDKEIIKSGAETIGNDLVNYEGNYTCMDEDKFRNVYFQTSIRKITHEEKINNWFEIGPGASGTLSKMVLEADDSTRLFAVEALASSVRLISRKLKSYIKVDRFKVVQGIIGQNPEPVIDFHAEALVAEILGHFGSSEGYVHLLHVLGKHQSLYKIRITVPMYFGTCMVPVDLSRLKSARMSFFGPKLVMFYKFPFEQTQLVAPSAHGIMEIYNSMREMRENTQHAGPRHFECHWKINCEQPRPFHGFGFYLFYGDSEEGPWQTSNASSEKASTNWSNPFIPVNGGQSVVENMDIIKCVTKCMVDQHEPSYVYTVTIERMNVQILKQTIEINYKDLIPWIYTFNQVKRW